MDYFGINSSEELPRIKEVLADQAVEPTIVNPAISSGDEDAEAFSVSESGDLVINKDEQGEES